MLKAKEQERDERIFQQWVVQLPAMSMAGEYISFEQYRDTLTGANIDKRPTWQIMAELDEIEKSFEKGEDT